MKRQGNIMEEHTEIKQLPIASLHQYHNHPFKLYTDKRLDDLIESVKANGILSPLIVRTIDGGYEILSGHNRAEAARLAGLDTVPAIIRDDLTDESAAFIVTETNLLQRSFADLSHSERANALAAHYEAIKHQGQRNDLLCQLSEFIDTDRKQTVRQSGEKKSSDQQTAETYGLSARNVSRYVRLSKLIKPLQERLDNNEFPFLAGVELAYISSKQQGWIEKVLNENEGYRIDVPKSALLRKTLSSEELDYIGVKTIVSSNEMPENITTQGVRIGNKMLLKYDYFRSYHTEEEVENVIDKALALYFNQNQ